MRTLLSICFLVIVWIFEVKCASNLHTKTKGRIINGQKADTKDAMHQVSIRDKIRDNPLFRSAHICGGSLIASKVVVTSASCFLTGTLTAFRNAQEFYVVMGTLDVNEVDELYYYDISDRAIEDFMIHNNTSCENNIALVFLEIEVPVGHPAIKPIKLRRNEVMEGTMCEITGWGACDLLVPTQYLQKGKVPIFNLKKCKKMYMEQNWTVFGGQICASYPDYDTPDLSVGDYGGPLVCNNLLTGIASFTSFGTLSRKLPSLYIEVAYYVDWIMDELEKRDLTLTGVGGGINKSSFLNCCFTLRSFSVITLLFSLITK